MTDSGTSAKLGESTEPETLDDGTARQGDPVEGDNDPLGYLRGPNQRQPSSPEPSHDSSAQEDGSAPFSAAAPGSHGPEQESAEKRDSGPQRAANGEPDSQEALESSQRPAGHGAVDTSAHSAADTCGAASIPAGSTGARSQTAQSEMSPPHQALVQNDSLLPEEPLITKEPIAPFDDDDDDPARSARVRMVVAAAVIAVVAMVGVGFVWSVGKLLESFDQAVQEPSRTKTSGAARDRRSRYVRGLQDNRAAHERGRPKTPRLGVAPGPGPSGSAPALSPSEAIGETRAAAPPSVGSETPPNARPKGPRGHQGSRPNRGRRSALNATDTVQEQQVLDELERVYGSRSRYRERMRARQYAAAAKKQTVAPVDVEGVRIKVRLHDDVASNPANAPVVAHVRTRTKLGDIVVPPGSEVHGTVVGGEEGRVFAAFNFIKLKGKKGSKVLIHGVARGDRGRLGIRAAKTLTKESGESVGQGAATGALRGVTGAIGATGVAGRVVGGALDATVNKADEKIKAIDNDHIVAVATKGEPFEIYITGLGSE